MTEAGRVEWEGSVLFLAANLPLGISLLVAIGAFTFGVDASLRYFELAAQILPVLLLALVVEQRYFFQEISPDIPASPLGPTQVQWKRMTAKIYEYQVWMLVLLIGGEIAALWAVAAEQTSRVAFAITTAGLVAAGLAVAVSAAKGLITSLGERENERIMKSLREKLEKERDLRLDVYERFIRVADDLPNRVPEAERPEFEEKMEASVRSLLDIDVRLSTDHFQDEFDRLLEGKREDRLTPGQERALDLMHRVKASSG
ncbi:MAG TPA: hypothetical protein VFY75_10240 [Solirubrobacterales bacterium]|nr:hypothetical protein [Solirubrobacterales bacterium]